MEYKFTTSFGFKSIYILLAILLVLFLWMYLYSGNIYSILEDRGALILFILGFIIDCLVFINLYKRKVIINDNSLVYVNVWGFKRIAKEY